MRYRIVLSAACVPLLATLATTATAEPPCREGFHKVGEKVERIGNTEYVHPICRPDSKPIALPTVTIGRAQVKWLGIEDTLVQADGKPLPPRPQSSDLNVRRELGISTGPNGHAEVVLDGSKRIYLGKNTSVRFYPRPKIPKLTNFELIMTQGFIKWSSQKVEAIAKSYSPKIKIGMVAVAIRGTDFEASIDERGNGYLRLNSGEIGYGKDAATILRPGQTLLIRGNVITGVE